MIFSQFLFMVWPLLRLELSKIIHHSPFHALLFVALKIFNVLPLMIGDQGKWRNSARGSATEARGHDPNQQTHPSLDKC